ncbi:MAG: DUF882 domain-containing protein [Aureispira sp.]|nr:DUF882 domain-containing protein [Aureispira sp.]
MANGEKNAQLKQLNAKIIEWVKLYQKSGGRKKLPQETVAFFDKIKTAILPQTQQAIKKQGATQREQGPGAVVAAKKLSDSVGKGCANKKPDVKLVQELLNKNGASLTTDGLYGNNTLKAIKAYQQKTFGWADGAISANGKTAKALLGEAPAPSGTTTTTTTETTEEVVEIKGTGPSSGNFKFSEFVSKNDPVYKRNNGDPVKIVPQELWPNIQKLMKQLDVIRGALGVAMNINSGYRSPEHNANVGGATNSQHKLGTASDISCSIPPRKVHAVIAGLIDAGQISQGGLGLYNSFVHYDIRGSKARWNESSSDYMTPIVPNAPVDNNTDTNTDNNTDNNSGTVDNTTDEPQTVGSLTAAVGAGTSPNHNADVEKVQELLNKNGASLSVDGKYGNNTLTAIKAYQASIGMGNPDGIIGVDGTTWKALVKGEGGIGKVTIDTSKLSEDTGIGYDDNDKDTYRDQRDNPMLGDVTCNVTTLAMQLISLASGNEMELKQTAVDLLKAKGKTMTTDIQLEELLRQLCIAYNKEGGEYVTLSGSKYKCWQVAYILDQVSELFTKYVGKTVTIYPSLDKAGYDAKIVPALKEGAEIMLSNKMTHGGHIVKLASVRADGVVLNDPYGCLVEGAGKYLRNGEQLTGTKKSRILNNKNILEVRLQTNTSLKKKLYDLAAKGEGNLPGDTGKLNFYTWAEVKTYKIGKWVNITYKK